MKICSNVEILS